MRTSRRASGQALVFGALTLFCLVSFAAAAFDVGQVSARRLQVQNAADQAALAGAQVEADLLGEVGWINDGMGYVYFNLMRYAVDVTVFGVLAELKLHGPPYPDDVLVGVSDPVGQYDEAYGRAQAWIERGQDWIDHLEKLEDAITIAAPGLIREEVFRVALAHGAEKVAIFPDLTFYPDRENYLLLSIERLSNGWRLSDSNGYTVEILVLGPDSYQVTSSTSGSFTVVKNADGSYTVTSEGGTYTLTPTALGWIVSGSAGTFAVSPGPNGGVLIQGASSSGEFQMGPNGTYQQFNAGTGQWEEMGGDSIMIDGVPVPINQGSIQVGGATITLQPLAIGVDNLQITFAGDEVVISGQIGIASISVQGDGAVVNGLSTQTADGLWYLVGGGDKVRHRMTEITPDSWEYEYVKEGSVLQVEPNRERFGVGIAVEENDPLFLAGSGYPAWMADPSNPLGWFDPRTGRSLSGVSYSQTRLCWNCAGGGLDPADPTVTCPLCNGTDNDGDGLTDVRKFQEDIAASTPDYQSVALPIPYVLGETFFRYGINVGVWKDKTKSLLSFPDPDWGSFAFASARAGYRSPATGLYTYGIADLAARDDWLAEDAANLYLADFEARLVSSRTTIRSDDLDMDAGVDTGANFLLRGFLQTRWLESADDRNPAWWVNGKLSNMLSKDGKRLDPGDPALEALMRH